MSGVVSLTQAQRARAASAYRLMLRAQRFTFGDDIIGLQTTYKVGRAMMYPILKLTNPKMATFPKIPGMDSLEKYHYTPQSNEDIDKAITELQTVANFLLKNVAQSKQSEEDEHSYKLRVTEHTERAKNEVTFTNDMPKMPENWTPCGGALTDERKLENKERRKKRSERYTKSD